MTTIGYHRLHLFVLGLAYALGKVTQIVPDTSSDLRSYFFAFGHRHKAELCLTAIMELACRIDLFDPVLQKIAHDYNMNPLLQRAECWDQIEDSFSPYSGLREGEMFDASLLKGECASLAREMYRSHQVGFDKLVLNMYRERSGSATGIVFFIQE
jgi:hypothetical protein